MQSREARHDASATGQAKPQSEVIPVSVPAIIDHETFDKVQKTLQAKNLRHSPPRAISGPILLTGLAHCASCGGAMTLRSGTSKNGNVYRYYPVLRPCVSEPVPARAVRSHWTSSTGSSPSMFPTAFSNRIGWKPCCNPSPTPSQDRC